MANYTLLVCKVQGHRQKLILLFQNILVNGDLRKTFDNTKQNLYPRTKGHPIVAQNLKLWTISSSFPHPLHHGRGLFFLQKDMLERAYMRFRHWVEKVVENEGGGFK